MSDIDCPYCGTGNEINHDDGYGYDEDQTHEQECPECEKTFVFTTTIHYFYASARADCLNGGDHKYKPTCTFPRQYSKMRCTDCGYEREPTEIEIATILGA